MFPFAYDNLHPQLTEPSKLHACNDNNNNSVHRIPTKKDTWRWKEYSYCRQHSYNKSSSGTLMYNRPHKEKFNGETLQWNDTTYIISRKTTWQQKHKITRPYVHVCTLQNRRYNTCEKLRISMWITENSYSICYLMWKYTISFFIFWVKYSQQTHTLAHSYWKITHWDFRVAQVRDMIKISLNLKYPQGKVGRTLKINCP